MVPHPIGFWAVSAQPLPWRYNIPHGSLPSVHWSFLPPISVWSLIPAFGHPYHIRATRSKEYYSRTYLSAFIPPLKDVGFLRYSCKPSRHGVPQNAKEDISWRSLGTPRRIYHLYILTAYIYIYLPTRTKSCSGTSWSLDNKICRRGDQPDSLSIWCLILSAALRKVFDASVRPLLSASDLTKYPPPLLFLCAKMSSLFASRSAA